MQTVWVSGDPVSVQPKPPIVTEPVKAVPQPTNQSYSQRDIDYESLTLMRLRQAQERKRLCQQLQEQTNSP